METGEVFSWSNAGNFVNLGLSVAGMGMAGASIAKSGATLKTMWNDELAMVSTAVSNATKKVIRKYKDTIEYLIKDNSGKVNLYTPRKSGKTTVTHRGTNANIAQKIQQGYLPANYPNPNNAVTRALDRSKPAVWVSEGKPNWFNRIFSGMIGKRGEASITFEIDSSLLKKPDGLIKRFFGKSQRVIEGDVAIPDDVIIKWGGDK